MKRNTVIEKKSFCWVLIAENLLYTSDQNRQIRMVDSFSNTLGFEKKLIESISYSDLLSKREIESNFLRDFESSFLGDSESLFQGEIGSFTKAKMGVRRSLLTYSCAF